MRGFSHLPEPLPCVSWVTTTSLPAWLPLLNLGISLLGLAFAVVLLIRSQAPEHIGRSALLFATLVLVGGAMNQAGMLTLDGWVLIGTGGRAAVVVLLTAELYPRWRFR